ncbi:MAG: ABC transporter permease [Bacteroidales bacterium]|nr:ABC transporter permease [Bacteroidales bacterium]
MRDLIIEIWESIRRNMLRTILTGFAVAWGIFMLMVLLGAGNGLKNATAAQMGDIDMHSMTISGGRTSMAYQGLPEGRRVRLSQGDYLATRSERFADKIDKVSPQASSSVTMVMGNRSVSARATGSNPEVNEIFRTKILEGRFINRNDIDQKRKVIVISEKQAESLSDGKISNKRMIGRSIQISGISFKVIGIKNSDEMTQNEDAIMPYSTMLSIFKSGNPNIESIIFSFEGLEEEGESEMFENEYRATLNANHRIAPGDRQGIWIDNHMTQSRQMDKGMSILNKALWIVGLFTLLSGIVGVSNIMLITVKERTHEFGIRKALGARPSSILRLIVCESVLITTVFGYVGMVLGMFACEIMNKTLGSSNTDVLGVSINMMKDTTVGLDVALEATLVLIIAGTLAGIIPARKASRVRPIEALRAN